MDRLQHGRHDIHCITGEGIAVVSSSQFLENVRKQGLEVPLMVDPVDDQAVQQLTAFDVKRLAYKQRRIRLVLGDEDEMTQLGEQTAEFEPLTKLKEAFGHKVENVIMSDRIVVSPCFLTTSECGWSTTWSAS